MDVGVREVLRFYKLKKNVKCRCISYIGQVLVIDEKRFKNGEQNRQLRLILLSSVVIF